MISIPITEEAYEALKARIPRIDQAPTSQGRNGPDADLARSQICRAAPGAPAPPAKAIATLFCGWPRPRPMFPQIFL